jgi:hypothetical protein
MDSTHNDLERGQSIVLVAFTMVALIIFAAIAIDMSSAYVGRRTAQNGADAAALAGTRQLADQVNHDSFNDTLILFELEDFTGRNGAKGRVEGIYLDGNGDPIEGAAVGGGYVPNDAWGIEATAYLTAPTFLGGILGFNGYPVQATAAALLEYACGVDCLLPIAMHTLPFTLTQGTCYNIWNGAGSGNFGWLNWTKQEATYQWGACTPNTLEYDMTPGLCNSGLVEVGDWIAGTVGVNDAPKVRNSLKYYIDNEVPVTVVVWDESQGTGCGSAEGGLAYRAAGFARMLLLGYQLPQGQGVVTYPEDFDPEDPVNGCATVGLDPNNGFRISGRFLDWAEGEGGNCEAIGTVRAPRQIR